MTIILFKRISEGRVAFCADTKYMNHESCLFLPKLTNRPLLEYGHMVFAAASDDAKDGELLKFDIALAAMRATSRDELLSQLTQAASEIYRRKRDTKEAFADVDWFLGMPKIVPNAVTIFAGQNNMVVDISERTHLCIGSGRLAAEAVVSLSDEQLALGFDEKTVVVGGVLAAKLTTKDCGGNSDLWVLGCDGTLEKVSSEKVLELEEQSRSMVDKALRQLGNVERAVGQSSDKEKE
jgi:hypothetical protein